ncbi:MAG: cysteine synthase family protein [candidate division Zixibacteria bacterium]|nr:cysteine synthase family protein [candidate division Zixibacteria bacterium]
MRVYESILDLIGNTPLLRLRTGIPPNGPKAYVKLEWYNPTGSVKDRMTLYIIRKALAEGRLKPGDTVIDNTSGNTGSALALVASILGLKAILTTPKKTSKEKIDLIRSYGAELIITPEVPHDDPASFYSVARRLAKENGYFDMDQYDNQDNVEAHYVATGPEIWEDTKGKITHFVCGIGTGGTFSGAARYLKEKNPKIKNIAVDPEGSIFTDYIKKGIETEGHPYKVEGIGSDVMTRAMHPSVVDELITVSDKDSFNRARLVTSEEGISAGGSSGTVAFAMEQVALELGPESLIVGIFADAGIKYLSKCYNDNWMREQGYFSNEEISR